MSASVAYSEPMAGVIPAGTWEVDPNHSSVEFQVKRLKISTVKGRFTVVAGGLEVGEDGALRAHGTVQAAFIDTHEGQRDQHLRLADFFDAGVYPQIRFTSTEITPAGGTSVRIVGELTIKGQTRPVELTAEVGHVRVVPWGSERIEVALRGELSRRDFGLTWNKALGAGGALVSDRVKIEADMKLVRRVQPARMAAVSSPAPGRALAYRGSSADTKPAQKMTKRWAMESARFSASRPPSRGRED